MSALVEALLPKVKLNPNGSQRLKTFAVFNGKLIKEYGLADPISSTHDSFSLYVEEIPTEEIEAQEDEPILNCFHYTGDVSRLHGIPFKIVVKENEEIRDTKTRIRARLGMSEKDFAKVKFVLCHQSGKVTPLEDGKIYPLFVLTKLKGDTLQMRAASILFA
jgi:ubiquitin carboxyl-terminal hydrolase 7